MSEHVFTSLQYGNIGDLRYREFGSGVDAAGRGIVLTRLTPWVTTRSVTRPDLLAA